MAASASRPRLVVGISGASGSIYGIRLLQLLRRMDVESHLVLSRSAQVTLGHETDVGVEALKAMADVSYAQEDIGAAIASGSFRTLGMVVAPCSIKTLSEVASGVTSSLLTRAADVALKERRRLVLMVRETPLHLGHLRLMAQVTEAGGIILPPVPGFYHRPQTIQDVIDQTVTKILDLFGIHVELIERWQGLG